MIVNLLLFFWIIYATALICYVSGWCCGRYQIMVAAIGALSFFGGLFATFPMAWFDVHYLPFYAEGKGDVQSLTMVISGAMNIHAMRHGFSVGVRKRITN